MIFFWKDPIYQKIRRPLHAWIRPYRLLIMGGVLMAFISAGVSSGVPVLLRDLIDKVFAQKNTHLLFILPFSFFILFSVKGFTGFFQAYLLKKAALFMISDVRQSLFNHLVRMPLSAFGREGTGQLMSRVTNDTIILQGGVAEIIRDLLRNSFTAVGMLIALLYINYKLTLFILLVMPFTLIPIRKIGKKLRKSSIRSQERYGNVNQHLAETLTAIRLIKSVGSEEEEIRRFRYYSHEYAEGQFKMVKYENMLSPIMESIGALGIGVAVWLGGYSVIHGQLSLGTLVGFLTAAQMLYQPIKGLGNSQAGIQSSLAAAERIAEVLDRPLEDLNSDQSGWIVDPLKKEIRFQDVSFGYPGIEDPALADISLAIPAGGFVAIVGPSGSGKSTLVNLIPLFYRPAKGEILWDGKNILEAEIRSLRNRIGIVTQDVILMNQTIRENLVYGLKKEVSREEIEAATRVAHADGFIARLPEGIETVVGEKGIFLSGGERQRLALARVVLRNPSVLILDEATSALDTESEFAVQQALESIMRDRTTIVIAHRLSTIRKAQIVHVLDKGRIVESGTHEELMRTDGGRYQRFLNLSLGNETPPVSVQNTRGEHS
uniref:ABC transporter ATP-binding protein n=1 Tax=Leptospirillum ferriphilum TaxID=178606 RepID=A0A7C3LUC5_9BACT